MKRPLILAIVIVLLIGIVAVAALLLNNSPDTSDVTVRDCITGSDDSCLALPQITGENLEGDEITLPDAISSDYALVVMPFSREQQEAAQGWLPIFENMAQADERLSYYNLAVLVVEAPFRPLVTGGLNLGVRDPDVRQAVIVAFVEEEAQQQTIAALNVTNTDEMLVLLVDSDGQVVWQGAGAHDDALETALRAAITKP